MEGTIDTTASTPQPATPSGGSLRPYLLVLSGPQFGEVFDLQPGVPLLVGRGPDAQVPFADEGVSRRHATLVVDGAEARLTDAGSANGTWVEGARVEEVVLRDGMRFQLGAHTLVKFVASDAPDAELQRRLTRGAFHEPLTGLYNRRHFLDRLEGEVAASRRHGRAVSLLLVDVDRLGEVNEGAGRLAGDEVLKMVAHVVQGTVRREDVVARYGGEEFVVLARETPLTGAKALAERIRRAVEQSRCAWDGRELAVTVSVGVTVSAGLAPDGGRTVHQLIEVADRAVRRAKQCGRNGVVAAPALGE